GGLGDVAAAFPSALRGSAVGSLLGILPGGGPTIAQFAAYAIDKKVSKYRHEIGSGSIEGVAGQAAADEAAARTSFIPLMSIGIPENAVMALMMAAFIIAVRGTVTQAVLLGLAATLSHTAVVWVIALGGQYLGQEWGGEASEPYFQLASAVLIVGIALWMARRSTSRPGPAC
ncbi:tripartite tricarboxylate transporter permease, partial [Xanthomonas sontii]|uniref:tripartite tricarboxylate transporter permease n=1 Tax=Xanthomonas sontii TaxID=2650745 RepID=UPI0027EE7544